MAGCLFCKIARGEIPAEKVYEDDSVFAFLDIHPINPGHTLVIPKAHATNIYEIGSKDFSRVMDVVRRLAPIIKKGTDADGINIGMNNDAAAGQAVFHAHVHIIPRYSGDGHEHWHGAEYPDGRMMELGAKLRGITEK